jgi:3-phenylpropionate/cinnamic acid dioxygenase small subunit
VSAADEIRNLLGRYCEIMDAADWAALGELFADGQLATEDGTVFAAGADAVRRRYEQGTRLYDGSPRTCHVTANSIVDIDIDRGDTASARSSYVVFQQVDGFALQPIITGRYRDDFVRRDSSWRFARRTFIVDHVGDLSHHLTYEVPRA